MIPVVDVFAGPGGLNEGFSTVKIDGERAFKTVLSIEMEASAVETLTFRAATRILRDKGQEKLVLDFLGRRISMEELSRDLEFQRALAEARNEVRQFTLSEASRADSDALITRALQEYQGDWVLIGGPPCQAYSLAGRSRRTNDPTFAEDHKHFLYKEYLHIIRKHKPTIFVMENVKGLLSAKIGNVSTFEMISGDLAHPAKGLEYDLHSMVVPTPATHEKTAKDFLIKSEDYGVPQKRHRIIIVGVRRDSMLGAPEPIRKTSTVNVQDALEGLPKLRSTVSRGSDDNGRRWLEAWAEAKAHLKLDHVIPNRTPFPTDSSASSDWTTPAANESIATYRKFVEGPEAGLATWNHAARGHMYADLVRYALLSQESVGMTSSRKYSFLDKKFWPNHANTSKESVPFEDRFRVQVNGSPSTTIVSHISKDGHYYIHPDPEQMRSLTVREAARLQTFPDDYVFMGNRTQQYVQVGNAVPPLLAAKIGFSVAKLLLQSPRFPGAGAQGSSVV